MTIEARETVGPLGLTFDYASCVAASERVSWRLDDVMPADATLDLSRPFLPPALGPVGDLDDLGPAERLALNHLAANAYLNLFQFVEEFILATVVEHAQAELFGDHDAIRALARFADEEIKHQQLFRRFRAAFDRACPVDAEVLDNAAEVAEAVLSKSPIGIMLLILHIELMTQDHYVQSVRDDAEIDPFFKSLLHAHWVEEAQHARIDALELDKLCAAAAPEQIAVGLRDYRDLLEAVDGLLVHQAALDLSAFERVIARKLSPDERVRVARAQAAGYRRTFLVAGLRSPQFVRWVGRLDADQAPELDELAARWSA
jgi:hypothetical protein